MEVNRKRLAGAAIAVVVAAGSGAALAVNRSSSPAAQARDAFLADVAERLNVSVDELRAALRGAAEARVDRALGEGRITEEQARRLRERIESGRYFGPLGRHGDRGHRGHLRGGLFHDAVTDYLGLSREALRERIRGGSSLADIARAEGKSVDDLKRAIGDAAAGRLDEAVASGRITEEQRQRRLELLDAKLDALVERSFRPHR